MRQMVLIIKDIANKSRIMKQGLGNELRTLAEGAEEMRILGSILSINKGLKATFSDAETFIDTIENLIYDRIKNMGGNPSDHDKIDFHRFFTDMKY
jgi:Mg2+/Co2+ transporter CorC